MPLGPNRFLTGIPRGAKDDTPVPMHPIVKQEPALKDGYTRVKALRHQDDYAPNKEVPNVHDERRYLHDVIPTKELEDDTYYPRCNWDIDEVGNIGAITPI